MTIDALASRIALPDSSTRFVPDLKKYADIKIDYKTSTFPFPDGVYLRTKSLETLSSIATNGTAIEIVGGDGDGKSTMTKELERYNRDHGRQVVRVDILEQRTQGLLPADEYFGSYIAQVPEGVKPLFIIDGADELWYKEGGINGKNLTELETAAQNGRLTPKEEAELLVMKRKNGYIDWLINNRDVIDLVLSSHDEDTPNARYTDIYLKTKFHKGINPYISRILYTRYSSEDAEVLLRHYGITHPDLIRTIIKVSKCFHRNLKAIACMKLNGLTITDALGGRGGEPISVTVQVSNEKVLASWLQIAEQRKLIG